MKKNVGLFIFLIFVSLLMFCVTNKDFLAATINQSDTNDLILSKNDSLNTKNKSPNNPNSSSQSSAKSESSNSSSKQSTKSNSLNSSSNKPTSSVGSDISSSSPSSSSLPSSSSSSGSASSSSSSSSSSRSAPKLLPKGSEINDKELTSEDWDAALKINSRDKNSDGTFNFIKENKSSTDNSKWMLYIGVGLIILSLLTMVYALKLMSKKAKPSKKSRNKRRRR